MNESQNTEIQVKNITGKTFIDLDNDALAEISIWLSHFESIFCSLTNSNLNLNLISLMGVEKYALIDALKSDIFIQNSLIEFHAKINAKESAVEVLNSTFKNSLQSIF